MGFFYRLLQYFSISVTDSNCLILQEQLYQQSIRKWIEPIEGKSVKIQVTLMDEVEDAMVDEELVVMLPENLF